MKAKIIWKQALIGCIIMLWGAAELEAKPSPENPVPEVDVQALLKEECMSLHRCESSVKCPYNRTCFNNCDIGFDGGVVGRKAGNFFLNLLGGEVEESHLKGCYANCFAKLDKQCQGPQPTDTNEGPPLDDPALTCRQYCGAEKNLNNEFGWCESTCRSLDALSACYRSATDPEADCDPVQLVGNIADQNRQTHMRNAAQVQEKMRGFAFEALCVRKPTAKRCATLCQDHADLKWCQLKALAKSQEEAAAEAARAATVDTGVSDTSTATETVGQTGTRMLDQLKDDKKAYSDEMGEIDKRQ